MNVDAALKANAQLAKSCQPCMGALNDPAVAPQALAALNAAPGDAVCNASGLQMRAAAPIVVALVCVQLIWPLARAARATGDCRHRIDQGLKGY